MDQFDNSRDRRQFGRRHTHLRGKIRLPGRGMRFCSVRNISQGGALLVFDRAECLPFGFLLTIEGEQTVYGCEVRHHFGERVGVAFVDETLIVPTDPDSWLAPNSTQHRT